MTSKIREIEMTKTTKQCGVWIYGQFGQHFSQKAQIKLPSDEIAEYLGHGDARLGMGRNHCIRKSKRRKIPHTG